MADDHPDMHTTGQNDNGAAPPNGSAAAHNDPTEAREPVSRETGLPLVAGQKLAATIVSTILQQVQSTDKAWRTMVTDEQQRFRDAVLVKVNDCLRKAVTIIAKRKFDAAQLTLKEEKSDGTTLRITLTGDTKTNREFRHRLIDHEERPVVLVLADHTEYTQAKADPIDRKESAQGDIEDLRPPIATFTDDELATLMGGKPLRPSDKWFFSKEELAAEHMRREDEKKAAPRDAAGNELAADPETGEIKPGGAEYVTAADETAAAASKSPHALDGAAAGEGEAPEALRQAASRTSPESRTKRVRAKKGAGAETPPTAGETDAERDEREAHDREIEQTYAHQLRADTRSEDHIKRQLAQSEKARQALADVGEL